MLTGLLLYFFFDPLLNLLNSFAPLSFILSFTLLTSPRMEVTQEGLTLATTHLLLNPLLGFIKCHRHVRYCIPPNHRGGQIYRLPF